MAGLEFTIPILADIAWILIVPALRDPLMRYVLKGPVATMNAALRVFPAGAVYIDGQGISAVQDSAAPRRLILPVQPP
jgi:hypothetical protein